MYGLAESSWDEKEVEAMQDVIRSGRFTMGKKVREYEEAFAQWVGAKYAVMTNSGSSANLLMIAALHYAKHIDSRSTKNEIVVPAVAWSTTYAPVHQYGFKIVLADVDPCTLNMTEEALSQSLSENTAAVLVVNILGNPCDLPRLCEIAGAIPLLEDNCESMGARHQDKLCGTFGVVGTFSTFFAHHISTMEGGVAVTDDAEIYRMMLALRAHGWTRDLPDGNGSPFRFVVPGYNLRPLELSGAIGVEQLRKLPSIVEQRRKNAVRFCEVVSRFDWVTAQRETGKSSWMGLPMLTDTPERRARLELSLRENGIEYRPILAGNFARSEMAQWCEIKTPADGLPGADRVHECGLFIGNHPRSLEHELQVFERALSAVS